MLTARQQKILNSIFLFHGLSKPEIDWVLIRYPGRQQTFEKGETVYSPNEFHRELGVILSGQIIVTKGNGDLTVSVLSAGDLFGAASLFNNRENYASVLTAKSKLTILFFTQDQISGMIHNAPAIRENYIHYLSERICFLSDKVDFLVQSSGEKKFSSFLLSAMDQNGLVNLTCSMTELASRLNIGRTSLYRELTNLENAGIVERSDKQIRILYPEKLKLN